MYLSTTDQNNTAASIAQWARENMPGHGAAATTVDQAGYPGAAVTAITPHGSTTCTAKVAVYSNRIVYASKLGIIDARPTTREDAGRTIRSLLLLEGR